MKRWRSNFLLFLLFLLGATLMGRLAFLQIVDAGFYKALSRGQQNISALDQGERGRILLRDKSGTLYTLSANQQAPFVFASPPDVEKPEEAAKKLSETLGIKEEKILEKFSHTDSLYKPIKKRITQEEEQTVSALQLPGIYIGQETIRTYPQEYMASHVIGFTNQDGEGQYGVESYYNSVLKGEEGLRNTSQNPAAYLLSALKETFRDGSDIILTIDFHIQAMAESLLEEAAANLNAKEGTVIVINPLDGKILALANTPRFNPNTYGEVEDLQIFQNSATQKLYEPGSIFKPITMAAALDAEAVTPHTTYIDKGIVKIGGRKIYNYDERVWNERTMTEVLEYSINTGVVFAERELGHDKFLSYVEQFGIFEPTNIGLAGEVSSNNTEFKKGYEINFATASFGQGIEMTPLQIVRAFSALANNGKLANLSIVEGDESSKEPRQIISPRAASQLTGMLASVVQNGFAKSAQIPGYHIAGKTGTAQISWSALGIAKSGYSNQTAQSFIGYAPAFAPRFLILVKLVDPAANTAEYSALPVFHDLAKYIIDYYQIPPDYEVK
jgi:stage V sporulation protein D (sporulation-specific penicillin-binding protein)